MNILKTLIVKLVRKHHSIMAKKILFCKDCSTTRHWSWLDHRYESRNIVKLFSVWIYQFNVWWLLCLCYCDFYVQYLHLQTLNRFLIYVIDGFPTPSSNGINKKMFLFIIIIKKIE